MKTHRSHVLLAAGVALAAAAGLLAAHAVGGFAFAKRADTALRAEPGPLASPTATLKLGAKLKVEEVRGTWLRVSGDKDAAGWIFAGNVAAEAPDENAGLAMVPLDAGATTATAAARPLAPAAEDYGRKRNLARAKADLDWLVRTGAGVTHADVTAYLQANRKGEYQ